MGIHVHLLQMSLPIKIMTDYFGLSLTQVAMIRLYFDNIYYHTISILVFTLSKMKNKNCQKSVKNEGNKFVVKIHLPNFHYDMKEDKN